MIVNERIVSYINSLNADNEGVLAEIENEAKAAGVPVIRKEMENFLKVMLAVKKPAGILEVGAAVGYSSILMSMNVDSDCHITTIENYDIRIEQARRNIARAGKEGQITLLEGDAMNILKDLPSQEYDFVFMDAAKAQYINFLPEVLRIMKPSALLISDNVLQEGSIAESRYAVTRRDRTIHARMREYMYELTHMNELITSIVPIGDGITMSVKRMEDNNA
ncbi:MAG: O-methyltransferase [Clostridia bacterium]|nr:O-methyltransferase [[Bacteroides] pectinophilus]MDD5874025.1 O-methyltransferase [Clostridia bacterium]